YLRTGIHAEDAAISTPESATGRLVARLTSTFRYPAGCSRAAARLIEDSCQEPRLPASLPAWLRSRRHQVLQGLAQPGRPPGTGMATTMFLCPWRFLISFRLRSTASARRTVTRASAYSLASSSSDGRAEPSG